MPADGLSRRDMLKKAAVGAAIVIPVMTSKAQSNGQTVPRAYIITIEIVGSGTVTPPGPVYVVPGGSYVFDLTPAPGWEVGNGNIVSGTATIGPGPGPNQGTVANVQSNCLVLITFVQASD